MNNTENTNNPWAYLGGNNPEVEPNFENMDDAQSKPQYPNPIASQYKSLYDELLAKCDFTNFSGDEEMATKANKIYGQLRRLQDKNSTELISIRNEAIEELRITISTEEKYNYLTKYCNPSLFKNPYNEEMVNKAIHFESRIKQNADNIIELEQIEKDAKEFILESKYASIVSKINDYIRRVDYYALSNYVSGSVLKDEMVKTHHIRDIFDMLILRVSYFTAIQMLKEAFKYDPAEKDYYTGKMIARRISVDTNVAITALRNTIQADSINEQYYNRVIQRIKEKRSADRKTNLTIILMVLGTVMLGILGLCIFPH